MSDFPNTKPEVLPLFAWGKERAVAKSNLPEPSGTSPEIPRNFLPSGTFRKENENLPEGFSFRKANSSTIPRNFLPSGISPLKGESPEGIISGSPRPHLLATAAGIGVPCGEGSPDSLRPDQRSRSGTAPDLRPYQREAIAAIEAELGAGRRTLLEMATGCHRAGQLILMHDGTVRRVEDVVVGDRLMGPDGTPRTVLRLARGRQEMVEIRPTKGEPWVVNLDHVLTLVRTPTGGPSPSDAGGVVVDVTVREWLTWSRTKKHTHKLFRVGVDFPERSIRIDPYVLGVLLGDGSLKRAVEVTCVDREIWAACEPEAKRWGLRFVPFESKDRCPGFRFASSSQGPGTNALLDELYWLGLRVGSGSKRIPRPYLLGSRAHRLEVLAGLIDTDGHMRDGGFEITSKSHGLADDVAFVARSLGLAAYVATKQVKYKGEQRTFHRVTLSGDCSVVPCRVFRKRAPARVQKKDVRRTGFTVAPTNTVEDYFGFALDGDQRYLLGDFTVTHNTGKTVTFAAVADFVVAGLFAERRAGRRVLVLAHRTELLTQALNKLRALGLDAAIEQAGKYALDADVVVASVQTLQRKRLEALDASEFGLVVVDECHHAAAKSYRAILDHFADVPVLGVTATAKRSDGKALGLEHGGIFETCCYRYELRQAIADGYLVKITARIVELRGVSLADIRTRAGDLDQQQLGEVMAEEEAVLGVVIPLLEQAGDRPTVLFAVNVAHAYALAEALCDRRPGCARAAHGELEADDRAEVLRAFRAREFQFLVNVELYTEGFDEPIVACVASAAPTKSWAKHMQRVGRGTRLLGLTYAESVANGKADLLVLDFVGDSGRHKLISPLDALAPGDIADDVREEADRLLAEGEQDLDTLLEEAERRIREKRAAARKTASASYFARDVDPFFGDEMLPVEKYDAVPLANEPAHLHLVQQIFDLTKVAPPKSLTNAEATRLLHALGLRKKRGLVTSQRMIRWLAPYVDVKTLPSDRARRMMPIVERHGWGRGDRKVIGRELRQLDLADRCATAFAGVARAIAKHRHENIAPIGEQLARRGLA
jgi:superfamily II DNA or RNA helicase